MNNDDYPIEPLGVVLYIIERYKPVCPHCLPAKTIAKTFDGDAKLFLLKICLCDINVIHLHYKYNISYNYGYRNRKKTNSF